MNDKREDNLIYEAWYNPMSWGRDEDQREDAEQLIGKVIKVNSWHEQLAAGADCHRDEEGHCMYGQEEDPNMHEAGPQPKSSDAIGIVNSVEDPKPAHPVEPYKSGPILVVDGTPFDVGRTGHGWFRIELKHVKEIPDPRQQT